jgi:hypothetical protein
MEDILIIADSVPVIVLYPTTVAPVCQEGDQFELTCTNNAGNFLLWRLPAYNEQGRFQVYERNINAVDRSQQASTLTLNSTAFMFMRNSTQGMTPLISTLVISSVSTALNGTTIQCMDVDTSVTASTTIHIFDGTQAYYAHG